MRYFITQPGAVLSFTGEDHQDFLQGQGTADLRGPTGFSRYSLWLDFKGNIMGDGYVLKLSDAEMLLISDQSSAESLIKKFDRHIIADDVVMSDKTAEFELISIPASCVDEATTSTGWTAPDEGAFVVQANATSFHGRRLGKGTLQVLLPVNSVLQQNHASMDFDEAEALRIQSAVPAIPADTDACSLNPLEANIVSPLSFTKGCYLGQEVVARVHRLGRVPRRLVMFRSECFSANPGDFLHKEGKEVGKITSVVKDCDNFVAIGWLKLRISDGELPFDEGPISVESLPPS